MDTHLWAATLLFCTVLSKSLLLAAPSINLNLIALRMAKILWSFGYSECNRLKSYDSVHFQWGGGGGCNWAVVLGIFQ